AHRVRPFVRAPRAPRRRGEGLCAHQGGNPDHADAQKRLAANPVQPGRLAQALEPYQPALLSAPNDVELRYGLGVSYANLGQSAAAKAQYEALKRLDAANAEELRFVIE